MQLIRAGLTRRVVCCGLVLAVCGLGLAPPAHADGCVDASELWGGYVTCTVMQQAQPAQQGMPAGQGAPGIPAAEPVQPEAPAQPGAPVAEPTPEKTCWDILATAPPGAGCKHNGRRSYFTTPQPIEEEIPAEPAEPGIDIAGVVSQASLELGVPAPVVRLGPDPSWNKWKLLAVGLPIWLWTEGIQPQTAATSMEGIDIQMQAVPGGATVDWGDGTVIWCATMTSKTRYTDPLLMSPDCGHKYEHPGDYTITVTQQWIVDWAALNQKGQLQLQSAGTYPNLPIRNFHAVVTG